MVQVAAAKPKTIAPGIQYEGKMKDRQPKGEGDLTILQCPSFKDQYLKPVLKIRGDFHGNEVADAELFLGYVEYNGSLSYSLIEIPKDKTTGIRGTILKISLKEGVLNGMPVKNLPEITVTMRENFKTKREVEFSVMMDNSISVQDRHKYPELISDFANAITGNTFNIILVNKVYGTELRSRNSLDYCDIDFVWLNSELMDDGIVRPTSNNSYEVEYPGGQRLSVTKNEYKIHVDSFSLKLADGGWFVLNDSVLTLKYPNHDTFTGEVARKDGNKLSSRTDFKNPLGLKLGIAQSSSTDYKPFNGFLRTVATNITEQYIEGLTPEQQSEHCMAAIDRFRKGNATHQDYSQLVKFGKFEGSFDDYKFRARINRNSGNTIVPSYNEIMSDVKFMDYGGYNDNYKEFVSLCSHNILKYLGYKNPDALDFEVHKQSPSYNEDVLKFQRAFEQRFAIIDKKLFYEFTPEGFSFFITPGSHETVFTALNCRHIYVPLNTNGTLRETGSGDRKIRVICNDIEILKYIKENEDQCRFLAIVQPGGDYYAEGYGTWDGSWHFAKPISLYLFNEGENKILMDLSYLLGSYSPDKIQRGVKVLEDKRAAKERREEYLRKHGHRVWYECPICRGRRGLTCPVCLGYGGEWRYEL